MPCMWRAVECGAVLAVSFVVEGYSLYVATRAVMQGAAAHGLTFVAFLRRGLDQWLGLGIPADKLVLGLPW